MQIDIRHAVPGDAAEVTACVCHAFIDYIPIIGKQPQPMLDDYLRLINQSMVYVAASDAKIVGVLVVGKTEEGFCIETLATHPALQGCGIGKKLIGWAEILAKQQQFKSIYLSTNSLMHKSQEIYKYLGFVEYDKCVVNGYDRIMMRKKI